jgi:CRISPR-associated protein Csb1
MTYDQLLNAVQSSAGLRLRLRLQPLYGQGEVIFPPTYASGGYLISPRRVPSYPDAVPCAIIDSVQSAANRMEEALLADIEAEKIHLPHVVTDFRGLEGLPKPLGKITSLDAPHRIFDAILRDSELGGVRFPHTDAGKAVVAASSKSATALFQYDPSSLLFGSWDSTGVSGGLGEKFTRCVVSEIVAVNATEQVDQNSGVRNRSGIRSDPFNSSSAVDCAEIAKANKDEIWLNRQAKSSKDKAKAAVVNHGNIVWPKSGETLHGGVSCDYLRQTTTISFPALRQLHFPVGGKSSYDAKAHAVLAAIALHAAALNVEKGWHLRSRCDLVLDEGESVTWELIGGETSQVSLKSEDTRALLLEAVKQAKAAGLPWEEKPLLLVPSKSLADLVRKSQELQSKTTEAAD